MSQKEVMPKSEDLSRSLEINAIWTFDTEFATIFNKSCTYITFKSELNLNYHEGTLVILLTCMTLNHRVSLPKPKRREETVFSLSLSQCVLLSNDETTNCFGSSSNTGLSFARITISVPKWTQEF